MSVLFCHDHRFVVDQNGQVLSPGQFSQAIVARYASVFGEMRVAARVRPAGFTQHDRLNLVFPDSSHFTAIPDMSSLKTLLFGSPVARRALEEAVAQTDAVIVRLPSEIGLMAARIARKQGKPLIVEVVGCIWDSLTSHGSRGARSYRYLAFLRMRRAIRKADWVLYVTERFLQSRYPTGGHTVHASNVQLAPRAEESLDKRLAGLRNTEDQLVFGMIAAMFHNEKRVDVAISALAHAGDKAGNIRLEIVGAGDTSELQAHAQKLGVGDRVRFLGVLPHGEALFYWIDSVDAYVQTSFQEGLPRALIEALSRATPVLASNAGGTGELISREWLHSPGDFRKLAEQMAVLRSKELRGRLAVENFARAADYTSDLLDQRRRGFWQRFCAQSGISTPLSPKSSP